MITTAKDSASDASTWLGQRPLRRGGQSLESPGKGDIAG
ncbi:hypothetical protein HRUBRA_01054 [Pseudohaliea rubra DSM 19751]|uniref:Uncharacterized protein n=1 Tax=Pseudohaliea rubra DSM 19751 TaxID=1265313 RepID=A0A095VTE2_9GAMM|nr:hypothetical protein HRUBRA_01054 [Pseudohaliea rubra DSM 19751]